MTSSRSSAGSPPTGSTRSGFGRAKPRARGSARAPGPAAAGGALRIAGVQMASAPKVAANLTEASRLVEMAVAQGARLVALPENFAIMGLKDEDKLQARERPGEGPIQAFLAETSARLGVWLVGGSVPMESSDPARFHHACLVFDDRGAQVGRYDKMHLFKLDMAGEHYSEARTVAPGREVVVLDSPFGRIGLAVGYDLRFPELFRAMREVDLVIVPSSFTETTGRAHWETLVRARAIENLAYVLAPAQGGYHLGGRETHGHSMIVDPWGVVLDRLPRGSGVVIADINPAYQANLRKSLPVLRHRSSEPL